MKRVLLCLPQDLLTAVDQEARYNYMSRSELMRRALLWYLRPKGLSRHTNAANDVAGDTAQYDESEELSVNPQELLEILQQQKLRAGIRARLREHKRKRSAK